MKTLQKNDANVGVVDKDLKNKFRWSWLDHEVKVIHVKDGRELSCTVEENGIKKIAVAGKAYCSLCGDMISYGSKGRIALTDPL